MKPSIRTTLLALSLLSVMTPGLARAAGNTLYEQAQQLQSSQQAPQFKIGTTAYQLVPQASVVPGDQAKDAQAGPSARGNGSSSAPIAASRLGPYAIVLSNNSTPKIRSEASGSNNYSVAVNMKTGLPVLILPQLQLQVKAPGQGQALAQALGGKLLFDGPDSLMVVVGFDSVAAALQALPQARAQDNVQSAQPAVQRRFRKVR